MSTGPKPLTAPPAPNLDWSRDGTPASSSFNDIYFSVDGGLEETAAVFLKACNLPKAWEDEPVFVIGELGFGSGLNFLAAWDLWNKTAGPEQCLHFVSVEAYPWPAEDLRKALGAWPELKPLAEQLIDLWPGQVKGVHRLHFGNVTLTLFHEDIDRALGNMDARMDAWFLDGFSPAKNPDMWSQAVFDKLAALSNPGAMIGTFTVAGHVRRGLAQAGFNVSKKPGFGRKRERLEAIYPGAPEPEKPSKYAPVILGSGIAGAYLAQSFSRRGVAPILIDPETDLASAASGNPTGLVMPRLDLQDRPESRFFLAAYLYALAQYENAGAVQTQGILHLAKSDNDKTRFDKLSAQAPLPPHHLKRVDALQSAKISGLNIDQSMGGLYFPHAQTIDPKAAITAWTKNCTRITDCAAKILRQDGLWHVQNSGGEILAVTDKLFVTVGANILDLAELDVRFTRGQICWGDAENLPRTTLTYGGYCAPFKNGLLLGATHDHVGPGQNTDTRPEDTQANIDEFVTLCGADIDAKKWKSRAAIRVTTKDTLPIAYQKEEGLFVMSGLGSRGMMMAPLLGEALVCKALGEPAPLCAATKLRFIKK